MAKKPEPAATRAYPTLKQWLQSDANVARAREILADPVYLAMMHYAKELTRPKVEDFTGSTALLDTEIVRKAALNSGVCQITDIFRRIFSKPNAGSTTLSAWDHLELPNE